MRPDGLTILLGGVPSASDSAALAAALTCLVEEEHAAPADPLPPAYRSRWRRAALLESADVPGNLKDDGAPWGVV